MLGVPVITDNSTQPVPVGAGWASTATVQPLVAVEAWGQLRSGNSIPAGYPWARMVFTASRWRLDDFELGDDFVDLTLAGFSEENSLWADPYTDLPTGVVLPAQGGYFWGDQSIPSSQCGYRTVGS
jgi:hypothetical protein